jgi:choline dehydrogenase
MMKNLSFTNSGSLRFFKKFNKHLKNFQSSFISTQKKFNTINDRSHSTPDYIIIGGGSAGCVLANRLSEDPNTKVLLIEAGHNDKWKMDSWKIHMPAALTYNIANEKYNWNYLTEVQKNLKNRKLVWPRGKVLGGSSSLNAMCYVRGNALDYDRWAEQLPGWEYKNCLPYFKKAQTHEFGENEYRGGSGPLLVTRGNTKNELFENFINAGIDCGYSYTDDMNGYKQEGFGPMECTINKGLRWSTSTAYIKPIKHRRNLEINLNSYANKIIFDNNKNAIGVEISQKDYLGNEKIINLYSNREIIVSGGAINSPQLLMLSGIGNEEELEKIGIKAIHHLPEVGENLQDHLEVYLQSECIHPITLVKVKIIK